MCFQLGYFKDLQDSWPWKGTTEEHMPSGPCGAEGWGADRILRPRRSRPCTPSSFSGARRGPRSLREGCPGAVARPQSAAPNTMGTRGKDKRPRALPSGADAWRFLLAAPTRRGRPPPRRPFSPFRLRRHPGCWVGQLKRPDTLATCCSSTHGGNEAAGSPWSGCPSGGVKVRKCCLVQHPKLFGRNLPEPHLGWTHRGTPRLLGLTEGLGNTVPPNSLSPGPPRPVPTCILQEGGLIWP